MKFGFKKTSLLAALMVGACAHPKSQEDLLKNTKKLAKEGHANLYQNGAFQIPSTHMYLIPPGPQPLEIASTTLVPGAKVSLYKALAAAEDSYTVVAKGTKTTFKTAGELSDAGRDARKYIQANLSPAGTLIIDTSSAAGKELIGQAWAYGNSAGETVKGYADSIQSTRKALLDAYEKDRQETKQHDQAQVAEADDRERDQQNICDGQKTAFRKMDSGQSSDSEEHR